MAVSKRLRYEVLRRDNHSCRYCGATAPDVKLTIDHVVPSSLGGPDEPTNLVSACADCNAGKATSIPDYASLPDINERELRRNEDAREREVTTIAMRLLFGVFDGCWRDYESESIIPRPLEWQRTVVGFWINGLSGPDIDTIMRSVMEDPTVDRANVWRSFCRLCWNELADRENSGPLALTCAKEVPSHA